jgi:hypothetical protein
MADKFLITYTNSFPKWFETVNKFYTEVLADTELQTNFQNPRWA